MLDFDDNDSLEHEQAIMLDNLRTMNAETENPAGSPNTVKESNHEHKPSLPKIKITSNPHSQMAGMTLNELAQHFLKNL